MPDTQHQLIEEALERFDDWASKTTADFRSEDGEDYNVEFSQLAFYDELKEKLKDELSLIARKSGEEGRKQGVAQAVSLFMGKIKSLSQDVLLEALSNPKEL